MVRNVHGTVVIVRENLLVKKLSSEKVDCAAAISYNLACDLTNCSNYEERSKRRKWRRGIGLLCAFALGCLSLVAGRRQGDRIVRIAKGPPCWQLSVTGPQADIRSK